MRSYLFLLLLLPLQYASKAQLAPRSTKPERPNVLFIAVDDLNDWTGYLGGHPQAHTPNLDRLAARGVAFTQAYCAAPICVPSRTALLTGIAPHVSGIMGNSGQFRKTMPAVETLPQRLRAGGYRVMAAGKIFHYPDPESWDLQVYPNNGLALNDPVREDRGLDMHGLEWGPLDVDPRLMADHKVSTWVCEQLGKPMEQPFFLACGLTKPHQPWSVPRSFFERFPLDQIQLPLTLEDDLDDLPKSGKLRALSLIHKALLEEGKMQAAVQAYLASIAYFDERLGVILDALAAGPHADNTLVVLWSDHGMGMGEKKHWRKSGLWEDITRVPLIFAGPGVEQGVRNPHAVGLIDLYRTIVELCGLTAPEAVAGYSLVPLLANQELARPAPVLTTLTNEHAVRSDRWRLIRYKDGSEELYDHQVDPHEWTNLASLLEHEELKASLRAYMPELSSYPRTKPKKRAMKTEEGED